MLLRHRNRHKKSYKVTYVRWADSDQFFSRDLEEDRLSLEHFSAKWLRFAVKNAASQGREIISRKWKQL
jgi:hypothetical protein